MKTPSFLELKTMVEYMMDEILDSQLQDIASTEDGLILSFYRFNKEPKSIYLIFDLDQSFPFIGIFNENPWAGIKKTKPVALFLSAHAKNKRLTQINMIPNLGRVMSLSFDDSCRIEFRIIPKQVNLIVETEKKSISWFPVKNLPEIEIDSVSIAEEEDVRSITFLAAQWLRIKGRESVANGQGSFSPYDKWKKNKEKDLTKKTKALDSVRDQIAKFQNEEWSEVGEHIKSSGLKNLKHEWSVYIDFDKSLSDNIQRCFEKAKAAKIKIKGAEERFKILQQEISELSDLSVEKFENYLARQGAKKKQISNRKIEGKFRKFVIESTDLIAYMGKSAADNMALLKKSKPHDLWLHLKDYPSAHAIIHLNKTQKVSDYDVKKIAIWLLKEGLPEKLVSMGGKFSVVIVECRHVRPIKGDKLGRVTYHNAREFLIAV